MTLTWNWGTGIAIVYTTFAVSTMGFVAFAMSRPVSLVSDDYYEQSLQEDAKRAATANATALGARASLTTADPAILQVRLPVEQASHASGVLTLYRPSDAARDRVVTLTLQQDGTQAVPLAGLQPGQWLARLRWTADGREYFLERPLVVR